MAWSQQSLNSPPRDIHSIKYGTSLLSRNMWDWKVAKAGNCLYHSWLRNSHGASAGAEAQWPLRYTVGEKSCHGKLHRFLCRLSVIFSCPLWYGCLLEPHPLVSINTCTCLFLDIKISFSGHSHFVSHCPCWKCTIVPVTQITSAVTVTVERPRGSGRVTTTLMHLPFHRGEKRSRQAPQFQPWPLKSLWKAGEGCKKHSDSQTKENATDRVISVRLIRKRTGRWYGYGRQMTLSGFSPLSSKERHRRESLFEYRQWGLCWRRM